MKTKRVNRYYCDFCKKSGCSKWHIAKHEKHCTLNPARECGVCKMSAVNQDQPDLKALIAIATREASLAVAFEPDTGYCQEMNLVPLREAAGGCPACILAALRQAGVATEEGSIFNFHEEMKAVWVSVNEMAQAEMSGGWNYCQ